MARHNEPLYSFAALQNRLIIAGTLTAQTALRIGAGRSNAVSGSDLPVLRDAVGRPFIPGASIKGALRARAEALVQAVTSDQNAAGFMAQLNTAVQTIRKHRERVTNEQLDQIIANVTTPDAPLDFEQLEGRTEAIGVFKSAARDLDDDQLTRMVWHLSSLVDLTFGSPQLAGRLFLRDAPVEEASWFGQHEVRSGVGLNRDTETAEENILYDYEVTPAGTQFAFRLTLENAEDWQLGMTLLLLKPWQRGEVAIGGFRSRGLGQVKLDVAVCRFVEITSAASAISLLRDDENQAGVAVDEARQKTWIAAFESALKEAAHA
jgi:CRISPR/Cas system CSM-associated protein Csm3 (group 7 of RAMP superfamily)